MAQTYALSALQDGQARIDRENGRMIGLSVITEGEAKGHEMWVDEISLQTLLKSVSVQSIQAYITHSGAIFGDRLTNEIGLFKNFRIEDDRVRADFHSFDSFREDDRAKYNRLFELAEKASNRFGISIVFSGSLAWATMSGDEPYSENGDRPEESRFEHPSVRFNKIDSADFVDDPAANSGLFCRKIDTPTNTNMTKDELQTQLSAVEVEKDALSTRIDQLETEKKAADQEVEALSAKLTEAEGKLTAKDAEIADTEKAHADALAAKDGELNAKDKRIGELEEIVNGSEPLGGGSGEDEVTDPKKTFSRKERGEVISTYAKEHGISEFAATVKLGKERPELWAKTTK